VPILNKDELKHILTGKRQLKYQGGFRLKAATAAGLNHKRHFGEGCFELAAVNNNITGGEVREWKFEVRGSWAV